MLKNKRRFVVIGVAGALVLLLGGAGIAYAQRPLPPAGDQSFLGGDRFPGGMFGRGYAGAPGRGRRIDGRPLHGVVEVIADLTDMSEEDIIAALRDGETVAEIANGANVELQEIVDAMVAQAESRLGEAVDNGRLTDEQKTEMLERLREELPERLEQPWQPEGPKGGLFGQFGDAFWTRYDAVAEALGLDPEDLFTELHDGQTLAEIAEELGVDTEEIRQALDEAGEALRAEAIQQAAEDGRITEDQAEWMLEGLEKGFLPRERGLGCGEGFQAPRGRGRGRGMGW